MGRPAVELRGKRFQRLLVVGKAPNVGDHAGWLCLCDCGTLKVIGGNHLRDGSTVSCGCYAADLHAETISTATQSRVTHGHTRGGKTLTYASWAAMLQRCLNSNDQRFYDYGGRGIGVCDRWLSFENFLEDMGERPAGHLSIDRIDNMGDYRPGNCKWSTAKEQAANRRPRRPNRKPYQRKPPS